MTMMDRRRMLQAALGSLVTATTVVALIPTSAEAMPLATGTAAAQCLSQGNSAELPITPVHCRRVRRRVCVRTRANVRRCYWKWVCR